MCNDRITPVLEEVLGVVLAEFAECEAPKFCRVGLVGGNAAWDDCCDCGGKNGQLWVRLVDWQPDPDFDQPSPFGCDQPSLLSVGVGVLRCIPTLDEHGNPPSALDEARAAGRLHSDSQIVYNAVMCNIEERYWRGWQTLGYDGGCGGGEHLFQLPFGSCGC